MIVVMPARGGSKRIIGKNKKVFGTLPLIQGTIKKLESFKIFDKIIVSTDDLEIKQLAIEAGAECLFTRPPELSSDFVSTREVVRHAIGEIKKVYSLSSDFCCIYPTSILIEKEFILKGIDLYKKNSDKFIFSCKKYRHPIERAFYIDDGGFSKFQNAAKLNERTQDLKEAYHDAGQFYIGKENMWLSKKEILSNNSLPVLIPSHIALDIDDNEDWILAEYIYKSRNNLT